MFNRLIKLFCLINHLKIKFKLYGSGDTQLVTAKLARLLSCTQTQSVSTPYRQSILCNAPRMSKLNFKTKVNAILCLLLDFVINKFDRRHSQIYIACKTVWPGPVHLHVMKTKPLIGNFNHTHE